MSQTFVKPAPGTLKSAAFLLVIIMIPAAIASAVGGPSAGMSFGIAAGLVMAVSTFSTSAQAIASAALAGVLAALSAMAAGIPWAVAALMLVSAVLLAVTNQRSAGLMTLAPVIVIVFGTGTADLTWQEAFLYILLGGLFGWLVVRAMKFEAEPSPVPQRVAWMHAIVLGVLSAAAMYWALATNISHGYWIAITLVVALRPLPEQRADILRDRLWGTVLGALLALVAIVLLPESLAALAAAASLLLLAAYSMSGNYFLQTMFLTPMLLIFASLGNQQQGIEFTVERVAFTVIGIVIAVVAVILLDRWDRRVEARSA